MILSKDSDSNMQKSSIVINIVYTAYQISEHQFLRLLVGRRRLSHILSTRCSMSGILQIECGVHLRNCILLTPINRRLLANESTHSAKSTLAHTNQLRHRKGRPSATPRFKSQLSPSLEAAASSSSRRPKSRSTITTTKISRPGLLLQLLLLI